MMTTHTALEVDAEGAVAWAAAHPGWFIFPGRMTWDEDEKKWRKRPLVRWTEKASKDSDDIRAMWNDPKIGGTAVVCVACAPSGIWVLDQDRDLPDDDVGKQWTELLDAIRVSRGTLVLKSSSRGAPHYVFRQGTEWVAEGVWIGGEVKSSGMIVISSQEPLVDAPVSTAPRALLDRLRLGRPKGSHGRGACSQEEMYDWLATTPDVEDLFLDNVSGERFIDAVVGHMSKEIEDGAHRRMAALNAVFQAAIEACAGCYPAEHAYEAIRDSYRDHRLARGEGGDRGWSRSRELDYDLMWQSLIPSLKAGDHDDKIEETRANALDRFGMWSDSDEEIEDVIAKILGGTSTYSGADTEESPSVASTHTDSSGTHTDSSGTHDPSKSNESPSKSNVNPSNGSLADNGALKSAESKETSTSNPDPAPTGSSVDPDDWGLPSSPTGTGSAFAPTAPHLAVPVMDDAAFWGPHGDLVEALRGRTESSDVGVLGALLAFSGACLAGKAHFRVGVDVHGPNDYFLNIGASSAARKSSALSLVERGVIFDDDRLGAPGAMFMPRRISGIASGEKMVKIWEPIVGDDGMGGKVEEWPERRVIMVEGEASVVWKRAKRDGAVLSDIFCKTWDQSDLATHAVTSGSSMVPAERHLMSFIGCSTTHVAVAAAKQGDGTDAKSGFANRFLWLYLPDSKIDLPFGADLPTAAIRRFQDRLGLYDGSLGLIGETGFGVRAEFDPDARDMWADVYGHIKRDKGTAGFIEAMLSRAESHVLRIALNYWLSSGGDPTAVGVPALEAALAVWAYAKASVEYIFGGSTGDRDADNLVADLESRGGWATMEELRADMNKNSLAGLIKTGVEAGVLVEGTVSTGRSGRPPRAIGLIEWKREGRLAPMSSGVARVKGTPLSVVTWL